MLSSAMAILNPAIVNTEFSSVSTEFSFLNLRSSIDDTKKNSFGSAEFGIGNLGI